MSRTWYTFQYLFILLHISSVYPKVRALPFFSSFAVLCILTWCLPTPQFYLQCIWRPHFIYCAQSYRYFVVLLKTEFAFLFPCCFWVTHERIGGVAFSSHLKIGCYFIYMVKHSGIPSHWLQEIQFLSPTISGNLWNAK